jgi:hypothetical protein
MLNSHRIIILFKIPVFQSIFTGMIKFILRHTIGLRMTGIGLLLFQMSSAWVEAQNSSFEFWPETDIWYRISPSWRLSAFMPMTKYHESQYRDINVYLQADYAWGKTKYMHYLRLFDENRAQQMKAWLVRGGYMKGWSLGEHSGAYYEDMLFGEIHRRIPVGDKFLISQRLRPELRWLGEDQDFSYRFRYRLMVEKELTSGSCSMVPYINAEPYWDSRYSAFTRIRVIGGTSLSWGPRFAFEGNLTYQHDNHYDTSNLYAINIILHVYFERKSSRSKTQ